jgi:hypothetical protein
MQRQVIRIADRRDGGQPVECATEDDDNETRIAPSGRAGEFLQIGPGEDGGRAGKQAATGGGVIGYRRGSCDISILLPVLAPKARLG